MTAYRNLTDAELAALVQANLETNAAIRELARAIAARNGVTLDEPAPQPNKPRPKNTSYRFTNLTRDGEGNLVGTVNYADGETFGRVYTDKEKATKFAERQRRSPIVKSARVTQVS